jgi:hypothetical protein
MDFTMDDDATVDLGIVCASTPVANSAQTPAGTSTKATHWKVARR